MLGLLADNATNHTAALRDTLDNWNGQAIYPMNKQVSYIPSIAVIDGEICLIVLYDYYDASFSDMESEIQQRGWLIEAIGWDSNL